MSILQRIRGIKGCPYFSKGLTLPMAVKIPAHFPGWKMGVMGDERCPKCGSSRITERAKGDNFIAGEAPECLDCGAYGDSSPF